MTNEKKGRNQRPEDPILDLPGPAAWGEKPDNGPRTGSRQIRKITPASGKTNKKRLTAPKQPRKKRRWLSTLIWTFIAFFMAGLLGLFGIYAYFSQDLPSVTSLKNYNPKTVTHFYSDDGRVIGEYYHERRFVKPVNEIPPTVINAFIAVEDAQFFDHHGISPKAIIRAALANFRSGEASQGGSTITQQVVKSFLLTSERKMSRKIKEMILAYRLEGDLTKHEILYLYLNQIYLGRGAYGVEAAAQRYFDKNVENLTIAEAAMLAGITHSPEGKNPITEPGEARTRQLYGIKRMKDNDFITLEQAETARAEILNVRAELPNPNTTVAPYFAEHVRRVMEKEFGADSLYNDGWKVYTTLNVESQQAADTAVNQGLWEYARRRGFKGPVKHLDGEESINVFLKATDRRLPDEGLVSGRLYDAVVMVVDEKNIALDVSVGSYKGTITKKNLTWGLKGAIGKRFSRGDVVAVRVIDPDAKTKSEPEKNDNQDQSTELADLAALIAQDHNNVFNFSLEQNTDVQAALLSMNLANGDIKAMVGGRDFSESQFNRAIQSQRQPGSSFKPILYASAMDNGFTPGSIVIDAPVVIDDKGSRKRWKPVNADRTFKGPMTVYNALVSSRNLVSIKILDRIGFDALQTTANNLGITETLPRSLTVALGSHGIKMPEMLTAYSAFPNMGRRVVPRYITRIEDRHGRVVRVIEAEAYQAVPPGTACAVTSMMRGVVAQGTGRSVKALNRPVGGKTGTTNDYSDAWFIGFTPELVTAVWLGTDQQRPKAVGEVGGRAAGPIFLYYMREVLKDVPVKDFIVPPDAVMEPGGAFGICYKTGTIGQGFSETAPEANPEDEFLRGDFEDGSNIEIIGDGGD